MRETAKARGEDESWISFVRRRTEDLEMVLRREARMHEGNDESWDTESLQAAVLRGREALQKATELKSEEKKSAKTVHQKEKRLHLGAALFSF